MRNARAYIDGKRLERLRKALFARELTVAEIANTFGVSRTHLNRLIHKHGWEEAIVRRQNTQAAA